MAINTTMVCLKQGQNGSGSCSGSEMERKILLFINLWQNCPEFTGEEGGNRLPDQSSILGCLQPRLETTLIFAI